jgi:hypothetical protein
VSELGREISNFQNAMPTVRIGRALRRKLLGPNKFDCAARVVHGDQAGVRPRWRSRISHVEGNELHFGSRAIPLELTEQVPHPGGFLLNAATIVWRARVLGSDAVLELAFAPVLAERILRSGLAGGRDLELDPHIDDL